MIEQLKAATYTKIVQDLMCCLGTRFIIDYAFANAKPFFICKILDASQRNVYLFDLNTNCVLDDTWIESNVEKACKNIVSCLLNPSVTFKHQDGKTADALASITTFEALMIYLDMSDSQRERTT